MEVSLQILTLSRCCGAKAGLSLHASVSIRKKKELATGLAVGSALMGGLDGKEGDCKCIKLHD